MNDIVALIPARSGSKRLPGKNIKFLGGHPLIAYTIEVALQSKLFDGVYVSTDDLETEAIAQYYGAKVIKRPKVLAQDDSPDVLWVSHALGNIPFSPYFAILRPTNPFRTTDMIVRAWGEWKISLYDSLRAIELVTQHPYKMWTHAEHSRIEPMFNTYGAMYDLPTQSLHREWYVQNGSLQISKSELVKRDRVTGDTVFGFVTQGYEGYDINDEKDWIYALHLVTTGKVKLIEIDKKPWVSPC